HGTGTRTDRPPSQRKGRRMSSDEAATHARPSAKRGLGRGLGALLGEVRREEPLVTTGSDHTHDAVVSPRPAGLANVAVAAIEPHPEQPRRHFDEAALSDLAASISERGLIQPVVVRPLGSGRYQLVAGERRWRAAQKAQLHEIPALIRQLDERDVAALALVENIQREDLNPMEEATAYQRLTTAHHMSHAEVAQLVGKSRSHVANFLRLLTLPRSVRDHLVAGRLDMGHGRALIGHADAEELAQRAVDQRLSVREVE